MMAEKPKIKIIKCGHRFLLDALGETVPIYGENYALRVSIWDYKRLEEAYVKLKGEDNERGLPEELGEARSDKTGVRTWGSLAGETRGEGTG